MTLAAALDKIGRNRINKKRWYPRLASMRLTDIERAIGLPRRPPLREDEDARRVRRDAARLINSLTVYKDKEGARVAANAPMFLASYYQIIGDALLALAPLADRRPFCSTQDYVRLTVAEEIGRVNALDLDCPPIPKQAADTIKRLCVSRAGFAVADRCQ